MPAVQPYSAAQRLLGGFLSSTDPGGRDGNGNDKPPGMFSLRRYRKYFNVDTMVRQILELYLLDAKTEALQPIHEVPQPQDGVVVTQMMMHCNDGSCSYYPCKMLKHCRACTKSGMFLIQSSKIISLGIFQDCEYSAWRSSVIDLPSALQDVLDRMLDSVIGFINPRFLEKTSDTADL